MNSDQNKEMPYPLSEYASGQWWLKELALISIGRELTPDMVRAAMVACDFAASVFAARSAVPAQASAPDFADAQITVTQARNGKSKVVIDYYQLPYGTTKLYAAAQVPAQGEMVAKAKRYDWLRDQMQFSTSKGETPEMGLKSWLPAPDHNPHADWMSPRFEASVDRTVDAAMAAQPADDGSQG